ncbi:hypothetical protein TNCV_1057081 [Trichonephila clavipes]|nr:hypothetical protein TNCV_1057081 [Trichonephila clavipes]
MVFLYDPQSKRAIAKWKSPQSLSKNESHQDRSKEKAVLEMLLNIQVDLEEETKLMAEPLCVLLHGNALNSDPSSSLSFLRKQKQGFCHILLTPLILAPASSTYFLNWHVAYKVIDFSLKMELKTYRRLN